jgi:hypothetical protein
MSVVREAEKLRGLPLGRMVEDVEKNEKIRLYGRSVSTTVARVAGESTHAT